MMDISSFEYRNVQLNYTQEAAEDLFDSKGIFLEGFAQEAIDQYRSSQGDVWPTEPKYLNFEFTKHKVIDDEVVFTITAKFTDPY